MTIINTQQNSYSLSHYTALWLHGGRRLTLQVTVVNCRQHGDYTAFGSSVTVQLPVNKDNYIVTVQSPCSHSAAYSD